MKNASIRFAKTAINALLGIAGLKLVRAQASEHNSSTKYFNTGSRTPIEENSIELYNEFYSDDEALGGYYGDERRAFYRNLVSTLIASNVDFSEKSVADVGCGVGFLLQEIARRTSANSLSGFDFSEAAIRQNQRRFPECAFQTHDIYQPLPKAYDIVICTEVLEHLERPHEALGQLLSGTVDGGTLILTVPNGRLDTLLEHINFWSPESWKAFLHRECGKQTEQATRTIFNGENNLAILHKRSRDHGA